MIRKQNLLRQNGSALLQVIASVFVLSAGLTGALSLIVGAMQANRMTSERFIANSLAAEGIEAVQNLRDTNYLLYPNLPAVCWNFWSDTHLPGVPGDNIACSENGAIPGTNIHPWAPAQPPDDPLTIGVDESEFPKKFIADFNPETMNWNLISEDTFDGKPTTWTTVSPDYQGKFKLYKKTLNADSDFPVSFFTHDKYDSDAGGEGETVEETVYSRSIALYYIDSPGFIDDGGVLKNGYYPDDPDLDDRLLVVSEVTWSTGGKDHKVTLSKILTDYSQDE